MQILWNAMDPGSKVIALQQKLDEQTYKELCDHIDLRHKIQYGTLDYKASSRDDPTGLALVSEHKSYEQPTFPSTGGQEMQPQVDPTGTSEPGTYELDTFGNKG